MSEINHLQGTAMAVFDSSTLTASFASLNGDGFPAPVRMFKVFNASDTDFTINYDGTSTDQDFFPAGTTQIIDIQSNASNAAGLSGHLRMRTGQIIRGRGTAGTGNIYIIGYN